MGLLDSLLGAAKNAANQTARQAINSAGNAASNAASHAIHNAVNNAGKGKDKKGTVMNGESFTFQFNEIPSNVAELKALPGAALDTAYKTTALAMIVLCNYVKDKEATYEMIDYLNGPDDVSEATKQFYQERLEGAPYKPLSFFKGATPENNYTPTKPYTITVSSNPYSFDTENWAIMYVESSGADAPRTVKLRRKPSTNEWFIVEVQCLGDIRIPTAADPWS